ncbi:MAG: FKBP-type peptidyl-prolyl cis-trans isomerase [Bacteroidaceae bacterium]|nr:FKBP-type peptidyl-prolyl cis-trans isomerase [Bacteroidaceae bacterium]
MKKLLFTAAAALVAVAAISCGSNENATTITKGDLNKMDSLSYIYGMAIGHQLCIEGGIVKELELDMNRILSSLANSAMGKENIVGNDTLKEETMQKIYMKVFSRERQQEIQAAKQDSTGNTPLYANEETRQLTSAFVGTDLGLNIIKNNLPLQLVWVEKGINEVYEGKAPMSNIDANKYMRDYFAVKVPAQNKKASEEWLAKIEKQRGVKKTESGLLYKIEEEGDMSAKPTSLEDVVKVHYEGTTRTGKVFDSSYKRNAPIDFALNRVIKGWGEGLQLVGKGGKITLWIPSELAYGERGAGADIGPNEALCFVVELLDVNPGK